MLIDTHCHLDDERFNDDLDAVLKRADEAGVKGVLLPGADSDDLPKAKEISDKYPHVFYAAGVHPYHYEQYNEEWLLKYLSDSRCIAVGECGLDYFRLPKDIEEKEREKEAQKRVFKAQIELAVRVKKPLIVHVREASQDSFDLLQKFAANRVCGGVLHCYNASEVLLPLAKANFYFGIGGVLTFKNEKKLGEILPQIPKDKLIFETDAPYLTPHPHRGKRNEPAFTAIVVQKAADILGLDTRELEEISTQNAIALFKAFEKIN
jgi:TatD DNase family protein